MYPLLSRYLRAVFWLGLVQSSFWLQPEHLMQVNVLCSWWLVFVSLVLGDSWAILKARWQGPHILILLHTPPRLTERVQVPNIERL